MAGGDRREGRGHLSSIDMLPEEADNDIKWALDQLRESKLPQTTIFTEFNLRLMDKGIDPISKSAFNRYSVRKAVQYRKQDAARRMAAEMNRAFDPESTDELTIAVAELIKTGLHDALVDAEPGSKSMMEMSRALQSVVSAQKASAEHRRKLQEELDAKLKAAAAAVATAGKKGGVSKETLAEINRALGVG